LNWHPFLALVVLACADLALIILTLLEERGKLLRVSLGAVVLAVLSGFIFFGVYLFFKPSCAFLVVRDACEFPGLFPGEVLLIHKTKEEDKAKLGDVVAFDDDNGEPLVARVVGMGKGVLEVFGPRVSIDQKNIETLEAGEVRLLRDELKREADGLVLYLEKTSENSYPVFYKKGVLTAPRKSEVMENQVALVCDNRSTAWLKASSNLFVVPRERILGHLGQILWSYSEENKRIRLERIGAIWH
jgi:hypothetical protein